MESHYSFIYISFMSKYIEHSLLTFTFSFVTIFLGRKILMYFFISKGTKLPFQFSYKRNNKCV
jgi:hypothetical protein